MQLKFTGLLACLAAALLLAACGGGGNGGGEEDTDATTRASDGASTPAAAPEETEAPEDDEPSEEDLREAALDVAQAFVQEDAAKAYSYFHSSYQEKCSLGQWAVAMAFLLGFYGESFKQSEPRVDDVRIEGNKGYVNVGFYLDGRRLEIDEDDPEEDPWLWEDGKWWAGASVTDPSPCDLGTDATEGA